MATTVLPPVETGPAGPGNTDRTDPGQPLADRAGHGDPEAAAHPGRDRGDRGGRVPGPGPAGLPALGHRHRPERLFSLDGFGRAYGNDRIGELIGNSLWFAIGAALLSLVVGTSLAYFNVRTDVPFKGLFFAASIIPLIIPGILYTIAWIFLASPEIGLVNSVLEPIFGPGAVDIFTIWGMIWVEGLHLSPIVFLFMVAAFRSTDPSLEESSLMSGATRVQTFRRVTMPLVRPALLAAALIMLVRSLESFEVPALLGLQNGTYVFTSRIYQVLRTYPHRLRRRRRAGLRAARHRRPRASGSPTG